MVDQRSQANARLCAGGRHLQQPGASVYQTGPSCLCCLRFLYRLQLGHHRWCAKWVARCVEDGSSRLELLSPGRAYHASRTWCGNLAGSLLPLGATPLLWSLPSNARNTESHALRPARPSLSLSNGTEYWKQDYAEQNRSGESRDNFACRREARRGVRGEWSLPGRDQRSGGV